MAMELQLTSRAQKAGLPPIGTAVGSEDMPLALLGSSETLGRHQASARTAAVRSQHFAFPTPPPTYPSPPAGIHSRHLPLRPSAFQAPSKSQMAASMMKKTALVSRTARVQVRLQAVQPVAIASSSAIGCIALPNWAPSVSVSHQPELISSSSFPCTRRPPCPCAAAWSPAPPL